VRGDVATAAKAIAEYARATQLLPFKGGLMDGAALDPEQIRSISRLPSREALYGQLVGVVASPVSGLVRTLGALVGGLAVALGQVREKKESGEIPAAEAPAAEAAPAAAEEPTAAAAPEPQEPAAEETAAEETAGPPAPGEAQAEAPAAETAPEPEAAPQDQAEPAAQDEPAQEDDNQADASADRSEIDQQPDDADANPTKED
jgi:large subunit ribosomal protein L10